LSVHGYLRYTKDIDLIIQLVPDNVERTFAALASIGYRLAAPWTTAEFADKGHRERRIAQRGDHDLAFLSDVYAESPVRVLAREMFAFDEEYDRSLVKSIGDLPVPVISIRTLISLKEAAGRPRDLADADQLRMVMQQSQGNEPGADGIDWSLTTWEGSRREQLRRWAELSFDEILAAQEEMADLARRLAEIREAKTFSRRIGSAPRAGDESLGHSR
jgi:hypothetical protein